MTCTKQTRIVSVRSIPSLIKLSEKMIFHYEVGTLIIKLGQNKLYMFPTLEECTDEIEMHGQ